MHFKTLLFIVSFLTVSSHCVSQNKISFSETKELDVDLSKNFKSYKILLMEDNMTTMSNGQNLTIAYGRDYTFELKENRLLSSDNSLIIKKESNSESKNIFDTDFDGKYYRNASTSLNNQLALSTYENLYSIYIKSSEKEFYIEPLKRFDVTTSEKYYIYYETKDIVDNANLSCPVVEKKYKHLNLTESSLLEPSDVCKTVELNFCVDYSMYVNYNSINDLLNRLLEVLNLTQLNYSISNGLAYDVNFKVKRLYIITCNQCNYWPNTSDMYANSLNFNNNYMQMFDYASDIRVFWQSSNDIITPDINGLGTQPDFGECSTVPLVTVRQVVLKDFMASTNGTRLVLSHEIGHNFGCGHVNDLNNIMSGCCYTGNTWNPSSIALINYRLQSSNCFYDCATDSCNNKKVVNLVVNIDSLNKTINANWEPETGIQYKARLFNFTTNTWSEYTTLSFPLNSITYNYNTSTTNCSNKYKFEIIPVCSDLNGFSQIIMLTVPTVSSPNLFFESTEQDNIICSSLEYTFSVDASYPGTTPVYQWKINNTNVGFNSPTYTTSSLQNNDILSCDITSNDPCLTSQLGTVSKTVTVAPQPCSYLSNSEFEISDIEFYPNPVKNYFTIKSITEIKNVIVYNTLGQKILEKRIDKSETILDLSSLSNATYFVKIEIDNKTQTIKIVKD